MKGFLKDQSGATTAEKIFVFSIIASLTFLLLLLRQYVVCENDKSITKYDIAIKKDEEMDASEKCEKKGEAAVPTEVDNEGIKYIPVSYLEEAGIEIVCKNSNNFFKFEIPANATPFSTGTQKLTVKNNKEWNMWIKIMKIETENGLKITKHSQGFNGVKSGGKTSFTIDWSWQPEVETNKGKATVFMQMVCSEPTHEERAKFTPEPPTNFAVVNKTSNSISLRWDEMEHADTYELVIHYIVFGVSYWETIYEGSDPFFKHENVLPGVGYNYYLYSGNTVDDLWSNYSYGYGKPINHEERPKTPTNVRVTETKETSAVLTWEDGSNTTGNFIELDGQMVYKGPGTSYTFDDLTPGKTHNGKITSYNEYGFSSAVTFSITAKGELVLDIWVEEVTENTVTFAWKPVEGAKLYTIDRGKDELWRGTDLSKKITRLTKGTTYTFTFYVELPRDKWEEVDITITSLGEKKIPDVPTNFRASDRKNTLLVLEWDEMKGATSYRLLNRWNSVLYEGPNTSFKITGLSKNTAYDYKVQAVNEHGRSLEAYITAKTKNDVFNGESEIGNEDRCEANAFEQKFQLPIEMKPGDNGQYVVEFNNKTEKNMLFKIKSIQTSGGLFRGETPVKLTYSTAHKTVLPSEKGRIPIEWVFPANAKMIDYQNSLGTLTANVELNCQ